ncbi:MAG: hypothetical protein Q9162_004685 [Coniocarpon cinnabarinum]
MDVAYDAVQKESYPPSKPATPDPSSTANSRNPSAESGTTRHGRSTSISQELRETYRDFSSSTWGAKFGGWWNTAKTQGQSYLETAREQGQSYYEAARTEFNAASESATGAADLTGNAGLVAAGRSESQERKQTTSEDEKKAETPRQGDKTDVPENLGKDIVKEAGSLLSGFQLMAGERLKQVQAAEDAADEALVKFGTNLRKYLKDAVTVTAPEGGTEGSVKNVLFESKDQEGRRVVHATRFEAQLHVIHTNLENFTTDPDSGEFAKWKTGFNVDKMTDAIARDLAKYEELQRSMERLVPEKVEYATFWTRYYFLRHVVEEQEQKRRELLKGAENEEEVKWDDDDDDDDDEEQQQTKAPATPKLGAKTDVGAETPKRSEKQREEDLLRPAESRRSNEQSVADSDTSYDMVSGATSRGSGSPKDEKERKMKAEQSDDEDWE